MTKKERKQLAQTLIMNQLAKIGYGSEYDEFLAEFDSDEEGQRVLFEQMNRVAKLMGYQTAWLY